MGRDTPAVIVMAKAPRPGFVKTRLRPFLSDVECAEVATCFLVDAVAKASTLSANSIVCFAPDDAEQEFRSVLYADCLFLPQRGSDLGERLESAIADVDAAGFGPIVVIGTDSPTLRASVIQSALDHLSANENVIAIGSTDDGGYYLIGMSRPHTEIFRDISWSTDRVYEQTLNAAKQITGGSILELPRWYDVDEPLDLLRLSEEFDSDEDTRATAPATYRWVSSHRESLRSVD